MTVKRFWDDPYRTALDTTVSGVAGDVVRLHETIFFAFSGGQESDAGTIAGLPVRAAEKRGLEIDYRLDPGHGLRAGQAVGVEIDGARRFCLMRLHFAAELVLELVTQSLPEARKIGAHIGAEKARIDFAYPENINGALSDLSRRLTEIVAADLKIECEFSDRAAERRYWKIAGFAKVPCGGTHCRTTGEIGAVTLKRRNPGKGKERIELSLD